MNIIFHHPLPIDYNAKSASGIRPLKMLEAFKLLGYHVDVIAGYSDERKKAIKLVRRKIKSGTRYDFIYSESSTMPTILSDPHHMPIAPLLDFNFFKFCKKNDIKIGLFYRDIYWLFDEIYKEGISPFKALVAKIAYRFDLLMYDKTLDKLFLPTEEMGKYIPTVSSSKFAVLPPGHVGHREVDSAKIEDTGRLKLFYVGGILSNHYQMHKLFQVVNAIPNIHLTVCTREEEWLAVEHEYPKLNNNIKVIHESGSDMEKHLLECDIALLFIKPQEYWEFSAPVKIYEYLGFEKPIIASKGTFAGVFVEKNNIGWCVKYDEEALHDLLITLINDINLISDVQKNMSSIAKNHSWLSRAKQVVEDLS